MRGRGVIQNTGLAALAAAVLVTAMRPASAETLQNALAKVYMTNPSLQAERARLRSVDEQVPEALSSWRPTATAQGDAGFSHQVFDNTSGNLKPSDASVSVSQPIYRGGRTVAATRQAEQTVFQERAELVAAEQKVLVDAATAYLDLLQDQTILDLQTGNEKTLEGWVTEAGERFRHGEKSRTDVSLFKSRLSRARADRVTAEISLRVARNAYIRLVGAPAGDLEEPDMTLPLPSTEDALTYEAIAAAPVVLAAVHAARAQDAGIDLAR